VNSRTNGGAPSTGGLSRFLAPRQERTPAVAPGLQRFLTPRKRAAPGERCEFCTESIAQDHPHVVNIETRSLMCACRGCFLLFAPDGAAGGKFRAVPDDVTVDPGFRLSAGQWDALQIPVGMAFFFHQSDLDRPVAFYPSPAGATESLLPLETWDELVEANPGLRGMLPDVQSLLVYRPREGAQRAYIVPIDSCYELVGLIRRYWKGFDGGEEAWRAIETFFAALSERSRPSRPRADA
jgi:Family of unknown function (DUF5947)